MMRLAAAVPVDDVAVVVEGTELLDGLVDGGGEGLGRDARRDGRVERDDGRVRRDELRLGREVVVEDVGPDVRVRRPV